MELREHTADAAMSFHLLGNFTLPRQVPALDGESLFSRIASQRESPADRDAYLHCIERAGQTGRSHPALPTRWTVERAAILGLIPLPNFAPLRRCTPLRHHSLSMSDPWPS
jgi:hypothetical protein